MRSLHVSVLDLIRHVLSWDAGRTEGLHLKRNTSESFPPPFFGGAHLEALPGSFKYPWNLEFHRRDAKRNKSTNPSISAWHKRWSAHMSTFPAQFVNRSFDSICPDGRGVSLCEPPLTGRFASRAWFRSVTYRLSGTRARNVCMGKSAVLHMLTPNRRGKISV